MKKHLVTQFASAITLAILSAGSALAASEGRSEALVIEPRISANREELAPSFGIYGGAASQNGDGYRTDPSFMLDFAIQPFIPFSFALQAQYAPSSLNVPFAKIDFNTSNLLLKEVLNFGGTIPVLRNSYVGTKIGATMYTGDIDTKTHLSAGPTLGFDIPLSPANNVSLGAEATYLAVLGDDLATPDQTSLLGAVKYWF